MNELLWKKDFKNSLKFAKELDQKDKLKKFKKEFLFPKIKKKNTLYFAGHSLGLQPKKTKYFINTEIKTWAQKAVLGHFHPKNAWVFYHNLLQSQMARLIGAKTKEVSIMNSLTINLHLMLISFYRPSKKRYKILMLADEFSSDRYAVASQIHFHKLPLSSALFFLSPRKDEWTFRTEDILKKINDHGNEISLILIGNVNFSTGQAFNVKTITKEAHRKGCKIGFDLAHGVGNLNLNLHKDGPDFAIWCTYKYLNGGPGSVGGCFIHERHLNSSNIPRFSGWWGHNEKTRFSMPFKMDPFNDARAWQLSNPPIFQMSALRASLSLFEDAGMKKIRKKSIQLSFFLEFLLKEEFQEKIKILTPTGSSERGSQISLIFKFIKSQKKAREFVRTCSTDGLIFDERNKIFRFTPAPLYTSYQDVYNFVRILKNSLKYFLKV